ncbi:hypothetical protein SESBI_14285 [Sesbania bispinosa]|nr:hypothetical protein SESBI_14285 [Sesbania bispinosa]
MKRVIVEAKGGQGEEHFWMHMRVCRITRGQHLHNRVMKIFRTREAYNEYEEVREKLSRFKVRVVALQVALLLFKLYLSL